MQLCLGAKHEHAELWAGPSAAGSPEAASPSLGQAQAQHVRSRMEVRPQDQSLSRLAEGPLKASRSQGSDLQTPPRVWRLKIWGVMQESHEMAPACRSADLGRCVTDTKWAKEAPRPVAPARQVRLPRSLSTGIPSRTAVRLQCHHLTGTPTPRSQRGLHRLNELFCQSPWMSQEVALSRSQRAVSCPHPQG